MFLWKDPQQIETIPGESDIRQALTHEVADILIYALLFCDALEIDASSAIKDKLELNAEEYPKELATGRTDKYTNLADD